MIINKQYIEIKSALRKKTKLVDTYFLSKYSFSPYRACQHACKYCDGRAEKYYVDGDFDKDIVIRKNLPILLEKELGKIREKGTISIGSGVSDAYQPIEKEEEIMRKCAEILSNHNLSAFVMTKSSLIMRDIDIWEKVHKKSGFTLMISLTFADSSYEHIREIFEPNVSSIEERFETLRAFKKRGMYIGVLAMPFIPYITDSEENILKLFENLKKIGTDFIVPGGLSLRPGKQKDVFMEVIKDKFPHLSKKIEIIYKENRQSGNSIFSYRKQFYRKMEKIFSLPSVAPVLTETPHRIYKNCFPIYDEIYILLNHLYLLYRLEFWVSQT